MIEGQVLLVLLGCVLVGVGTGLLFLGFNSPSVVELIFGVATFALGVFLTISGVIAIRKIRGNSR